MALWQYRLTALPAAGIQRRLGSIPPQLFIDQEGWRRYWDEQPASDSFTKPTFEDAHTIDWWEGIHVAAAPLVAKVDELVPRGSWGSVHVI